ncbi:MAG TPA: segregation/condensation protein A [Bacillota bacterium]|nr:segregation/condensation protein A [Bacillota bacterium]
MAYQIRLEAFEGPFDLLFHLIEKNEIDIYDIPIAEVTEQYLEYLDQMQKLDLDIASEFLVMAATLLSIKARMLLPKPPREEPEGEEGVDPRDELVERLLEYKKFKEVAEFLKEKETFQGKVYTRSNDEEMYASLFSPDNPLEGIDLKDLLGALQEVLNRVEEDLTPAEIPREEFSIRDKMREIARRLVFNPNGIPFSQLFARKHITRVEVVVTFLALLELIKLKKVAIHQSRVFGDITVYGRREDMAEGQEEAE